MSVRRLQAAGFSELAETEAWTLTGGERRYVVRNDGSLLAFELGAAPPHDTGFRLIGAHTDSPNLRVKPQPDTSVEGYRQLAVEPYGGVLLHTWLDRDLTLAGRVVLRGADGPETILVDFEKPILRIPNLAIHLYREIRTDGLLLNEQSHMTPLFAVDDEVTFVERLAAQISAQHDRDVDPSSIVSWELMTHDTQPAAIGGTLDELIFAPRLDNLASCHAALTALIETTATTAATGPAAHTRAIVLYDHEEVGSRSSQGAAGSFLLDSLDRVCAAAGGDAQSRARALALSSLVSADMAHALHPNYADRHEPGHRPMIGRGPVIKTNANLSYASDATTTGMFVDLCRRREIEPQHFVVRSDLPCGSTIGPITAARVGIRTVDVGNPMLAMHSCR
ncbi:MAG: M18 family aminopeptidase, partial [Myxococcales bacterium]